MYILQFDGMLQIVSKKVGQAGFLGYGWYIFKNEMVIARGFGLYAHRYKAHSNIAEYIALIEGLEALTDLKLWKKPIEIRGDAKCVIDQMKGEVAVNSHPTRELHRRAASLSANFYSLIWTWIPRKKNKLADRLSRRGLRQLYILPNAYEDLIKKMSIYSNTGSGLISLFDLNTYYSDGYCFQAIG